VTDSAGVAAAKESAFFFTRGGESLFGLLHAPVGAISPTAFVMSHPFGEEKLWSHRVFVTFARALAQRGHAVLRFDYFGAGDSSGRTSDSSLETHLSDLGAAVETLLARQPGVERVGLVGLRLGASIAALFAERGGHARLAGAPLILWDPVVDGENYFQELLRSNLSTQLAVYGKVREDREVLSERIRGGGTVNVDGYDIGQALFESCGRKDLLSAAKPAHAGPVLVTQIAAGASAKDREDLRVLAQAYPRGTFQRSTEQPFWREIKPFYGRAADLQKTTLEWLEGTNA
jgi:pimeloyl-ACP methyl ester carboxylesterase